MSHRAEFIDTQSMRINDKRYSSESNESILWEGSCDWSALIAHSGNSAFIIYPERLQLIE